MSHFQPHCSLAEAYLPRDLTKQSRDRAERNHRCRNMWPERGFMQHALFQDAGRGRSCGFPHNNRCFFCSYPPLLHTNPPLLANIDTPHFVSAHTNTLLEKCPQITLLPPRWPANINTTGTHHLLPHKPQESDPHPKDQSL